MRSRTAAAASVVATSATTAATTIGFITTALTAQSQSARMAGTPFGIPPKVTTFPATAARALCPTGATVSIAFRTAIGSRRANLAATISAIAIAVISGASTATTAACDDHAITELIATLSDI
jgi:hypothetical protein